MKKATLSKSTFLRGLKCHKNLYLYKNFYNLRDEISSSQQAVFNQGTDVGELAQQLFPDGVDASPTDYYKLQESVLKTKQFIEDGEKIIYEATFQFNGVIVALDILVIDDDCWKAYEVKSSTEVKPIYINDAAIQYYTMVNSGIELKDISIIHINNQYVKQGAIDINQLFSINSVFDEIQDLQEEIPKQIKEFNTIIKQDEVPKIDIGPQCGSPYACDFMGQCWKHIPEYSIFNIARLNGTKKFDLYKDGVVTFDQIDFEKHHLNAKQIMQVKSELEQKSYMNKPNIENFVNNLEYPIYHLDFETMATAVPIFDETRPYQQFVFQYSLHIEQENGTIEHREYLAEANPEIDPRDEFVKQLIDDCGNKGDVLVYNIGFERGKLNDLAELYPEYAAQIKSVIARLKDLMIPFQKRWYYTPQMRGSYSIKYVLPALVPELSYQDLEIKEGGTASNTFTQMVLGNFNDNLEKTRNDLLEYCKLDTFAMVKILEKLKTLPSF